MVPEDLLFWVAPIAGTPGDDRNVLCRRHADAMNVPRGWTLDDRREETLRLFMPTRFDSDEPAARRPRRSTRSAAAEPPVQLVIDGTGETERPDLGAAPPEPEETADSDEATTWAPAFDHDDDLDGLLEVSSPLLSRAFRGGGRRTS